jgi:hypothetical protein
MNGLQTVKTRSGTTGLILQIVYQGVVEKAEKKCQGGWPAIFCSPWVEYIRQLFPRVPRGAIGRVAP